MAFKLQHLADFFSSKALKVPLSVLALSACCSAWSFSLAHPNLLSHQGEPLKVEIELLELSAEEGLGLGVTVAKESTYQASHMEWDPSLSSTQVSLITTSAQRHVLRIEGQQALGPNFVDLLLEFHWATGSVNKEIGLILDKDPKTSGNTNLSNEVRIVQGDTASEIAARYLDPSTTLNQMLVALLRSNPKAFVQHNVNRMIAGQTLSIPSSAQASSVSVAQARDDIQLQNMDFAKYRESVLAKVNAAGALNANHKASGASGLVSQKSKALNSSNKDQLKLSQPSSPSAKAADQLAKSKEAMQNAERAKEIENNIDELTQIANEQKSWSHRFALFKAEIEHTFGAFWSQLPSAQSDLLTWLHHPLAPVLAGLGLAIVILGVLWSSRTPPSSSPHAQSTDFEGPNHDEVQLSSSLEHHNPFSQGIMQSAFARTETAQNQHEDPNQALNHSSNHPSNHPFNQAHAQTGGQLKDHINLDFDLDLPPLHEPVLEGETSQATQDFGHSNFSAPSHEVQELNAMHTEHPSLKLQDTENPLEIRFDLAQELWQVGQHHTARAIVQEIAQQATGELLHQAQAWLAQKG